MSTKIRGRPYIGDTRPRIRTNQRQYYVKKGYGPRIVVPEALAQKIKTMWLNRINQKEISEITGQSLYIIRKVCKAYHDEIEEQKEIVKQIDVDMSEIGDMTDDNNSLITTTSILEI